MRSRAGAVVGVGAVVIVVAAVVALLLDQRELAFTNGVAPGEEVVRLKPQLNACQRNVQVLAPFATIRLATDSHHRPGPLLRLTVLERRSGRVLGGGTVPAGYVTRLDAPQDQISGFVGRVKAKRAIDVCVTNVGGQAVALGGTLESRPENSDLTAGIRRARPVPGNLALSFLKPKPSSLLAELPAALRRAALFHPSFVGAWTFWVLAALLAVVVPLLLARAVTAVGDEGTGPAPPDA